MLIKLSLEFFGRKVYVATGHISHDIAKIS